MKDQKIYPEINTTIDIGPCNIARPKVIVLCGSSRFCSIMAVVAWFLERDEGAITMGLHLLPEWYFKNPIAHHLAEHEGVATHMDELHKRKIDLADEIFVINWENYIGESTMGEINYANKKGIKIRSLLYEEPEILSKLVDKMREVK